MKILLSWTCYWAGDLVSRSGVDRWWWGYQTYHRLMCWSDDLQRGNLSGPWRGA